MVSRWLAGKTLPTQYLDQIAQYFKVSVKTLFEEDLDASEPNIPAREITPEEALRALAKSLGIKRISLKK